MLQPISVSRFILKSYWLYHTYTYLLIHKNSWLVVDSYWLLLWNMILDSEPSGQWVPYFLLMPVRQYRFSLGSRISCYWLPSHCILLILDIFQWCHILHPNSQQYHLNIILHCLLHRKLIRFLEEVNEYLQFNWKLNWMGEITAVGELIPDETYFMY